ncbi:GspMb/PilO family protein [Ideonella sp. BN130291]|uniref:GspMb/PilO family protein n=1 Tax=Ideonella sp. BN130291 TaxID=3112940 RepID=UPI002E276EFD|nr:GspMb/PilO family protein [Ideonella sp. BN130291]
MKPLRVELGKAPALRLFARPGVLPAALLAAACLLATLAAWWRWTLDQRLIEANRMIQSLNVQAQSLARVSNNISPAPHAAQLRRLTANSPGLESLVAEFERAGPAANVQVLGLASTATPATAASLGRVDVDVTLAGSYAGMRQVLAEVLARYPAVVVRHLVFRKLNAPTELQAQVGVQLLSPPAGDSAEPLR